MKEIEQVVDRYLQEKDTDYAIMITGKWGCGKTYYVQNDLKNLIESKSNTNTQKKIKRKMVYISLYGLSCIDDLPQTVFRQTHKFVNNKIIKAAATVAEGAADYFGAGKDNVRQLVMDFYDVKNDKVLVFDDLERINYDKINIKEVLGAINQYAEVKKLKVIIISDESKIDNAYNEFKEKTIRYSIKFRRSLSDSFDAIISERKNDKYFEYLIQQKELIISIFKCGECNNLRTLKFVIDAFEEVYNNVKDSIYKDEIQETLLVSFLLYAIEYKNGNDIERLKQLEKLRFYTGYLDKNKDKRQDYLQELYEKYDRIRHDYTYYPVINNYITNGYIDNEEFDKQIKEIYDDFVRYAETPEGKLLKLFEDWKMIDDDNFATYISELIQYIKEVKYSIRALTTLYHQLLVIEYYGIEGFKVDDNLEKIFRDSAYEREHQDGFNLYLEKDIYQLTHSLFKEQLNERYNSFIKYIGEINRTLRATGEKNLIEGFMAALKKGDVDKITDYCSSANFQFLLENLDVDEVFEILKTSNKNIVRAFLSGFYTRFPDRVTGIAISPKERAFMNNLKNLLNDYLNDLKVKKVSSIWYYILINKLDAVIGQNNV